MTCMAGLRLSTGIGDALCALESMRGPIPDRRLEATLFCVETWHLSKKAGKVSRNSGITTHRPRRPASRHGPRLAELRRLAGFLFHSLESRTRSIYCSWDRRSAAILTFFPKEASDGRNGKQRSFSFGLDQAQGLQRHRPRQRPD